MRRGDAAREPGHWYDAVTQPGKYSEVYEGLKSGELLELEVLDTVGAHRGNVLCEIIGQTLDSEQGLPILHV